MFITARGWLKAEQAIEHMHTPSIFHGDALDRIVPDTHVYSQALQSEMAVALQLAPDHEGAAAAASRALPAS